MSQPEWLASLFHASAPPYLDHEPQLGRSVRLRLRAAHDAPIEAAYLRTTPDGEQKMEPMQRAATAGLCQWWEAELPLSMPRVNYRFEVRSPEGEWCLTAAGVTRHTPLDATDFKLLAGWNGPRWLHEALFYQIFPDRFADGDPSNNVRDGAYRCYGQPVRARAWDELPQRATGGSEFFGGDLQGIAQRLDYLEALGVTALYLNPIFTAPSNHKYDVADYGAVDPHFGGDAALVALRRALDERGMRLLLDVVPNHCGSMHPWFQQAQQDANSPTADFFTFHRRPDQYDAWLGVDTLPKLDYRSQRLREWMYAGPDAVLRRWLREPFRADGWRVDVANMLARQGESQLGHKIGRGIRRAVKAENPEAYLLGENFFDGSAHLQGDELDATMNYRGFTTPTLHWLGGAEPARLVGVASARARSLPSAALADQWRLFLGAIPWQVALQQYNLLGNHDTARLWTVLGGDMGKLRAAVVLLFTFPGVPAIYYGDEIGLQGGRDPDCRRPMPWQPEAWNHDLHSLHQRLAALRRRSSALQRGSFQLLHAAGDSVAFLRESPDERVVVLARRADDGLRALPLRGAAIADGSRCRELLSGSEATVTGGHLPLDALPPAGAQLWRVG